MNNISSDEKTEKNKKKKTKTESEKRKSETAREKNVYVFAYILWIHMCCKYRKINVMSTIITHKLYNKTKFNTKKRVQHTFNDLKMDSRRIND